jgi:hypothetical protein
MVDEAERSLFDWEGYFDQAFGRQRETSGEKQYLQGSSM